MKKLLLSFLALSILLNGCSSRDSKPSETDSQINIKHNEAVETNTPGLINSQTRTQTDCYDYEISLPESLSSISTNYQSATQIMLMLGGENIITGTSPKFVNRSWVQLMYPDFCSKVNCPFDSNGEFNVEELLIQKPELFLSYNTADTELIRNAGVTTANIGLYDYEGIEKSIITIGKLMGDSYKEQLEKWENYYQKNLRLVTERVKDIPEENKVRILFLRGDFEKTYGKNSVISSWINISGGINVLDGLDSKESIVLPSAEEILLSAPDYIIIGDTTSYSKAYETITGDERFSNMDVMKNNKILFNPVGLHQWEKYSGECALQILWAAKTFYPEKFKDIDLIDEIQYFYQTFHNFKLTDEQAKLILEGKTPEGTLS